MLIYKNRIFVVALITLFICIGRRSFADVDLPTCTRLKVVKVLYNSSPKQENNLFGDGYYGKVVRVREKDMKDFISNLQNVSMSKHKWAKGSLIEYYRLHLEILQHIEKNIKDTIGDKELKKLNKAIDLKKLKQNKNIYHRIKYRESGGLIRDARIWILIPDENIVCIFRHHT